jgi:hypothetical protein
MDYRRGLTNLRAQLPPEALEEFLVLEGRLQENLKQEQLFGGTETTRATRAQVVAGLNTLALQHIGQSFNALCLQTSPDGTGQAPRAGGPSAGQTLHVNTQGGAFIQGGLNLSGGDFVGRDKIIHGDVVHGDKVGGDQITVGDITNSAGIALGREAQANVTTSSGGARPAHEELDRLLAELTSLLNRLPAEQHEHVEVAAACTATVVEALSQDMAPKGTLRMGVSGLKQVAQHLADVAPEIGPLVAQINELVSKLTG